MSDRWLHDKFKIEEQGPRIKYIRQQVSFYYKKVLYSFHFISFSAIHEGNPVRKQYVIQPKSLSSPLHSQCIQQIHRHLNVQKNFSIAGAPTKNLTDPAASDRNVNNPTTSQQRNHDLINVQKDCSAAEQKAKNVIMPEASDHRILDRSLFPELVTAGGSDGYRSIQISIDSSGNPGLVARWSPFNNNSIFKQHK